MSLVHLVFFSRSLADLGHQSIAMAKKGELTVLDGWRSRIHVGGPSVAPDVNRRPHEGI